MLLLAAGGGKVVENTWPRPRQRATSAWPETKRGAGVNPRTDSAKTVAALVALVLVLGLASGADPATSQEGDTGGQTDAGVALDAPKLQTKSWALTDADTGLYLAGKNPDERLPIASTTKVMVALVALEEGVDLDEEVRSEERRVGKEGRSRWSP